MIGIQPRVMKRRAVLGVIASGCLSACLEAESEESQITSPQSTTVTTTTTQRTTTSTSTTPTAEQELTVQNDRIVEAEDRRGDSKAAVAALIENTGGSLYFQLTVSVRFRNSDDQIIASEERDFWHVGSDDTLRFLIVSDEAPDAVEGYDFSYRYTLYSDNEVANEFQQPQGVEVIRADATIENDAQNGEIETITIVGEIENVSEREYSEAIAWVRVLDQDDYILGSKPDNVRGLRPGQTYYFEVTFFADRNHFLRKYDHHKVIPGGCC